MTNIELTGNLTIQSIQQAASVFLTPISPSDFGDVNQLYTLLKSRGSLTLKDATLTLPINDPKTFFGVHRLILINSKIYCNSSDTFILCNEYEHNNSSINSFSQENFTAKNGSNATVEGQAGLDGENGLDASNIYCYITDKVKTIASTININLTGQNGGSGGNGMKGKKGEKGSSGRNCKSGHTPFDCKSGCGDGDKGKPGQKGGDAGDAGNGGNGGKFEFRFHGYNIPPDYYFSFLSNGGQTGGVGFVGDGGNGGDGGNAGKSGCQGCKGSCKAGPVGIKGQSGNVGNKGKTGSKNFLVNSNFDVTYLKLFIQSWNNLTIDKSLVIFEFESGLTKNASL